MEGGKDASAEERDGGEGEVVVEEKSAGDESGCGSMELMAVAMAASVMVREVDGESEREGSGRWRLMFLSS